MPIVKTIPNPKPIYHHQLLHSDYHEKQRDDIRNNKPVNFVPKQSSKYKFTKISVKTIEDI